MMNAERIATLESRLPTAGVPTMEQEAAAHVQTVAEQADERLTAITGEIAQLSTRIVRDVWAIGSRLNEARELLKTDEAFGRWRAEYIEPIGISIRTARRFGEIADRWTEDSLPEVPLSILYMLSADSTPAPVADALVPLVHARAAEARATDDAKPMTVSEVQRIVQDAKKGDLKGTPEYLARETVRSHKRAGTPAPQAVTVLADKLEEVPENGQRATTLTAAQMAERSESNAAAGCDSGEDWARGVIERLGTKGSKKQRERLGHLLGALITSGYLQNDAEAASVALENDGRIHIRD